MVESHALAKTRANTLRVLVSRTVVLNFPASSVRQTASVSPVSAS